jgi:hypothetical protein
VTISAIAIGDTVTFTIHRVISITRSGKVAEVAGSKQGMVGFQMKPFDKMGEFTLWVPAETAVGGILVKKQSFNWF